MIARGEQCGGEPIAVLPGFAPCTLKMSMQVSRASDGLECVADGPRAPYAQPLCCQRQHRPCMLSGGVAGGPQVCASALRRCAHICVMTDMRHYAHICTMTCIAGGGYHVRCVVMLAVAAPSPCLSCFSVLDPAVRHQAALPERDPQQAVLPARILQQPVAACFASPQRPLHPP